MSRYEISPREREDEDRFHEREFGVESHRAEDERADWFRVEDAPEEREE